MTIILIAEDTEDSRVMLEMALAAEGYKVMSGTNGIEALDLARKMSPDLIISDILMPKMDGFELCRQIKADPELKKIPFIFYTATYVEHQDKELAMALGASRFIIKPLEPQKLMSIIQKALAEKLPVSQMSKKDEYELNEMHLHSVGRKLDKKIEELEQQREALKQSEEKYRHLVESVQNYYFFYSHDKEGIFTYLSPSIEIILGYTPEDFFVHYSEYLTDNPVNKEVERHTKLSIKGEEQPPYELEIVAKDGSVHWIEVKEIPVFDKRGNVSHVEGIAHDITQRKQTEETLINTQKMDALGKLTGGIAHDFNNMIGVIIGYSELLQFKLSNDPTLEKYVSEILHAGERAKKLTSKLLAFSRKQITSAEVIDINTVIQGEQHLLEKTLTARINVVFKPAENLWPVCLDKASLEDAILNMSINALHAMPDGGTFTLDTRNMHLGMTEAQQMDVESGDYVLLSLTDTGIGMDETTQQKIFDPFFSTKGDMGTGLGMSQVYGFVKQSRGTIQLYSKPGQGTRFTIYFPRCVESRDVDSVQEVTSSVEMPTGKETILVVDDEPALCEFNKEVLTTHGYRVLCADGGEQAIDLLETETVDLLLTDVIMPGMDGYQLATIVKKCYPQVIIQVMSGFSEDYRVDVANEELHQQRLQKPFSSNELLQSIRQLLDERANQTQDIEVKVSAEFESLNSFEWSDQYSTGIHAIDTDHKALMVLAHRSLNAINSSEQKKEIRLILNELLDYTKFHFQREECIMKVCGFPDLTKHQQLHQILINEVKEKVKEFGLGNLTAKSLLEFLINWLTGHVKDENKLIVTCCEGKENLIEQALVDSGLNN